MPMEDLARTHPEIHRTLNRRAVRVKAVLVMVLAGVTLLAPFAVLGAWMVFAPLGMAVLVFLLMVVLWVILMLSAYPRSLDKIADERAAAAGRSATPPAE